MRITFLGTGTSQGIPVIGCNCETCLSDDPKDKRTRCSLYVEKGDINFVIDIGPDFRTQMLKNNLSKVDFVLLTHEHNDHTAGIDDIRPINFASKKHMDFYCSEWVANDLKKRFSYVFATNPYPGAPKINLNSIKSYQKLPIHGVDIYPLDIMHGRLPIFGFKIDNIAYLTDVSDIPEKSIPYLKNLDILIISALREEKHRAHLTLNQAIEWIEKLTPQKAYLIHMGHHLGKVRDWANKLPPHVFAAYDGLQVEVK